MSPSTYLFFRHHLPNSDTEQPAIPKGFTCEWRLMGIPFPPKVWGISRSRMRWNALSLLMGRPASALALFDDAGALAHRSTIVRRDFRYPFMASDDIMVTDVWTDPQHRGKGLGVMALKLILARPEHRRFRYVWYLTREENEPSVRLVTRAGFSLAGCGRRLENSRIHKLPRFVITDPTSDL